MRIDIGFDPGVNGAWAMVGHIGSSVSDFPKNNVTDRLDAYALSQSLHFLRTPQCLGLEIRFWIEDVRYLPNVDKGRAAGIVKLVHNRGVLEGVCAQFVGSSTHLVDAQRWHRLFGIQGGKEGKDRAREIASNLYPGLAPNLTRKKDDGRADAILVAHYGSRQVTR